jgi:hypothetical protein
MIDFQYNVKTKDKTTKKILGLSMCLSLLLLAIAATSKRCALVE